MLISLSEENIKSRQYYMLVVSENVIGVGIRK